jgi:hypothetical protein
MATTTTTPIQMHGYMISSSDINDDEKEAITPLNNPTANPRGYLDRAGGKASQMTGPQADPFKTAGLSSTTPPMKAGNYGRIHHIL